MKLTAFIHVSVGEPPTNGPHCCLNYSIKAGRGKDGVGVPNMRDDLNSLLDWNVAEHGGWSGGGRRVIVGSQAVNRTR